MYSQEEKVQITLDIAKKLKYFEGQGGQIVNLFNNNYIYVPKLKKIFNDYIHGNVEFRGTMEFEEIGKKIEYRFPIYKKYNPLFVIRI
jgi:hypothetical protein